MSLKRILSRICIKIYLGLVGAKGYAYFTNLAR